MSSYIQKLKNPKTGKMQVAYCIDNYYGGHIYGYGFPKDSKNADEDDWNIEFDDCDFYKESELTPTN